MTKTDLDKIMSLIDTKTSWGKVELKQEILYMLATEGREL